MNLTCLGFANIFWRQFRYLRHVARFQRKLEDNGLAFFDTSDGPDPELHPEQGDPYG